MARSVLGVSVGTTECGDNGDIKRFMGYEVGYGKYSDVKDLRQVLRWKYRFSFHLVNKKYFWSATVLPKNML